jgi:hypothetical protein
MLAIKLMQLVGSLQTFKNTLPRNSKGESLAMKSINEEESESSEIEYRVEEIALLAKKFANYLSNNSRNKGRGNSFVKPCREPKSNNNGI